VYATTGRPLPDIILLIEQHSQVADIIACYHDRVAIFLINDYKFHMHQKNLSILLKLAQQICCSVKTKGHRDIWKIRMTQTIVPLYFLHFLLLEQTSVIWYGYALLIVIVIYF